MIGDVEWNSTSTGEIARAAVTSCREIDGAYRIAFGWTAQWQDSRLILPVRFGQHRATAEYWVREGVADAQAMVDGELRSTPNGIEFIGTWRDWHDKDASTWLLLFEIAGIGVP